MVSNEPWNLSLSLLYPPIANRLPVNRGYFASFRTVHLLTFDIQLHPNKRAPTPLSPIYFSSPSPSPTRFVRQNPPPPPVFRHQNHLIPTSILPTHCLRSLSSLLARVSVHDVFHHEFPHTCYLGLLSLGCVSSSRLTYQFCVMARNSVYFYAAKEPR